MTIVYILCRTRAADVYGVARLSLCTIRLFCVPPVVKHCNVRLKFNMKPGTNRNTKI